MRIGSDANALEGVSMSAAANVVAKSDGANITASTIKDDGTTVSVGANKVTIAIASGNTTVAGTLTSTGAFVASSTLAVAGNAGFYGTAPVAKQAVTGSKATGAAWASLLAALVALGLVTDSTSA